MHISHEWDAPFGVKTIPHVRVVDGVLEVFFSRLGGSMRGRARHRPFPREVKTFSLLACLAFTILPTEIECLVVPL